MKTTTVIDYIVQRLADEGINHCFGVAGDYLFPVCDAVERNTKVKWIGCANELNASYAADGYARVSGRHGVCIAQNGPGITNFVTSTAAAFWAHSPVGQSANRDSSTDPAASGGISC